MHSTDMMIRKLQVNTQLSEQDISALYALPVRTKEVEKGAFIVREADRPNNCCLVLNGFLCRSKVAEIGERQILSFHIPGDIPDLQSLYLTVMDHDLVAVSSATLAFIAHDDLRRIIRGYPSVAEALWRDTLIDASIFREWIVNLGVRPAAARMAHLMAELRHRMAAVGLSLDNEFEFPITQADLADALGLTAVHVNRVLQNLRAQGFMDMRKSRIRLENLAGLTELGGFHDLYLHEI
jgi:CRP-like cAMP-binding protein